jgi:arabinan endo-1,5-alpha-L-arabinosidase
MKRSSMLTAPVVVCTALGCGAADETSPDIDSLSNALVTTSADQVLGFEAAELWQGPGALATNPIHTQGHSSLAVRPNGYSLYRSQQFAFKGRAKQLVLDLQLPTTQPNRYWLGALQVYFEAPANELFNAYVGQVELTGKPLGAFTSVQLDVPDTIAAVLAEGVAELQIKLALNVPGAPGTYLLDNLRIRTDLVAHYRFDSAPGGVVPDSSGWDRPASLRDGAALAENGHEGAALALSGTGAYVELPNSITDTLSEVSIAAWVNLDGVQAWSRLFDFGGANGFLYMTPATHDGFLRYSTFAGFGVEGTVTAPALSARTWHHVVVTTTSRDYRLYVDGVEAGSSLTVPVAPRDIGANGGNWIGKSRFPDPFLAGRVDDFRIYDRVLRQREIAELAAKQADYLSYRFDEKSGATVPESSELALHGTLVGHASRVPGLIGGALTLPGTGAHVQLPAGVVQSCSDLTISAWIKLHGNAPWNRVFDFGKPDFSSFMYLSPAGFGPNGQELRFGLISPRAAHDVGYPYVLPLEEWTHLAVVLRDETASLFLNGRAVVRRGGVTSNPSDMGVTTGNYLGRSTFNDPAMDGALDDVRISCRAFADSEIEQLAHLPAPAVLPAQLEVSGDVTQVHDPAVIRANGQYYLYSTGPGIVERRSSDLTSWTATGSVFVENPAWVKERFGELSALWAPDISNFGGTYHLYYAASSFGSNRSCIGHATKSNLAASGAWVDRGPVLCSNDAGSVDDFNAIDPNVTIAEDGTPWLSFGSFWSGLKLVKLTTNGARADTGIQAIAGRGGGPIEAPFIVFQKPYYYLFASFDFCCQGANSNYRQVVGRSRSITGPYLDRTGLPMLSGGGTPVLSGNARWRGPGHNALLRRGNELLNVYHAYDALNDGIPTLRIAQLNWQEGWPVAAEP